MNNAQAASQIPLLGIDYMLDMIEESRTHYEAWLDARWANTEFNVA